MVVSVWRPSTVEGTYYIKGQDGRSITAFFLPTNEVLFAYHEDQTGYLEVARYKATGQWGTHYFGPLWSVHQGSSFSPWNLRVHANGEKPVIAQMTVVKRFANSLGREVFKRTGAQYITQFLFKEKGVRIEDMWLDKEPVDKAMLTKLQTLLELSKEQ